MNVDIRSFKVDLKEKAESYLKILTDFRNSSYTSLFGQIGLYKKNRDEESYNSFKMVAENKKEQFNEIINQFLTVLDRENIGGTLLDLIRKLKKASNFDWKNMRKLEKFYGVYDKTLSKLNKLKIKDEGFEPELILDCSGCKKKTRHTFIGVMEGRDEDKKLILYNC